MRLKPGELIAVVAIVIVIIIGIGFGVYPALRRAPRDQCISNAKQVIRAVSMYAADYAGLFPPADDWADLMFEGHYNDTKRIFVCPEASPTSEQLAAMDREDALALPIGYSLFRPIAGANVMLIADMEHTPVLFDSDDYSPNSVGTLESLSFRHMGKTAVVLFADGHADPVKAAPQVPAKLFRTEQELQALTEAGKAPEAFGTRLGEGLGHDHGHSH